VVLTIQRFASRYWAPAGIAIWASALALAPSIPIKCSVAALLVVPAFAWWLLGHSYRWLVAFLLCSILLPPLPISMGDSGPHVAVLLLPIGAAVAILRPPRWECLAHSVSKCFLLFSGSLTLSLGFAAVYSGPLVALGSAVRVALFLIGPCVFFYILGSVKPLSLNLAAILFRAAVAGALFACLDFRYQFPAPAGYSAQFIWLNATVLRRAQGVFYEASTLGNFCAFFLVMALVTFVSSRRGRPCSRAEAALGSLVLGAALIFSYSRGSLLNIGCSCVALVCLRVRKARVVVSICLSVAFMLWLVHFVFPDFGENYWTRIQASFLNIHSAPDGTLSGRLSSWNAVLEFVKLHPWQTFFGVGYKTLPYSPVAGRLTVVDNTYLDLLVETGVLGLFTFLAFSRQILRCSLHAARSKNHKTAFYGSWIFCFWIGEMVQMFSGDLITYWRVLPIYFAVLAVALRDYVSPDRFEDSAEASLHPNPFPHAEPVSVR
jgi:O-antigen ligase